MERMHYTGNYERSQTNESAGISDSFDPCDSAHGDAPRLCADSKLDPRDQSETGDA